MLFGLKKYTCTIKVWKKRNQKQPILQASSICFSLGELEPVTSYNSQRFAIPSTHLVLHMVSRVSVLEHSHEKTTRCPLKTMTLEPKNQQRNSIAKKCERVRINNALLNPTYIPPKKLIIWPYTSYIQAFWNSRADKKVKIPMMART